MSWDDWSGRSVGGGWTRLYGEGPSVEWDPRAQQQAIAALPEPDPLVTVEEQAEETTAPGWEPVPDEPIVDYSRDALRFPLWPGQAAILSTVYAADIRTTVLRLGRRSGKDRMAAVVGTFEATVNAEAHLAHVPEGEQVAVAIVATSQAQGRIVHRFVRGFLAKLGSFRDGSGRLVEVTRTTEDLIELSNGMVIMTMPCTARSTRGYAVAVLILDEAAWMLDTDGSPLAAKEVWDSLAPATAQFPAGRIFVLSTPRWNTGWFADIVRQAESGAFPDMRAFWASTEQMNPHLAGSSWLATERERDPVAFRREYEASFGSGIGAVFPDGLVRAAASEQSQEPIALDASYAISLDAAYTRDTFAAVVGRRSTAGAVIVRHVQGWRGRPGSPVDHDRVLDEVAALSRAHNRAAVVLDQFASEPIKQGLAKRGVAAQTLPWTVETKVEAAAVTRQLLTQGNLVLPRHAELIAELVMLEQTPLPSGRVRIAAPRDAHDDYAMALLGLTKHLAGGSGWGINTSASWIA